MPRHAGLVLPEIDDSKNWKLGVSTSPGPLMPFYDGPPAFVIDDLPCSLTPTLNLILVPKQIDPGRLITITASTTYWNHGRRNEPVPADDRIHSVLG